VPFAGHSRTPLDGSQAKYGGKMRLARWSAAVVVILGAGLAGAFTGAYEQVCLLDSADYCYTTHDWASTQTLAGAAIGIVAGLLLVISWVCGERLIRRRQRHRVV
jgi:hypothetical protein